MPNTVKFHHHRDAEAGVFFAVATDVGFGSAPLSACGSLRNGTWRKSGLQRDASQVCLKKRVALSQNSFCCVSGFRLDQLNT
jgi:hypothetical protein